jgi:hypothetical protein
MKRGAIVSILHIKGHFKYSNLNDLFDDRNYLNRELGISYQVDTDKMIIDLAEVCKIIHSDAYEKIGLMDSSDKIFESCDNLIRVLADLFAFNRLSSAQVIAFYRETNLIYFYRKLSPNECKKQKKLDFTISKEDFLMSVGMRDKMVMVSEVIKNIKWSELDNIFGFENRESSGPFKVGPDNPWIKSLI